MAAFHSLKNDNKNGHFYDDAKDYWSQIPATVEGMLGGFGSLHPVDIRGSASFLKQFISEHDVGTERALDCGAGIGRITKHHLLPVFKTVDMVELNQSFLDEARNYLGDEAKRIGRFICSGLQEFTPEVGCYNVIWIQWVLGHLTDEHLVAFFKRCKAGLKDNGVIFVKENVGSSRETEVDEQDSSVTRPRHAIVQCIEKAELRILREKKQKGFPKEIYEVRMFAIR